MLLSFPLLAISLIVYNLLAFGAPFMISDFEAAGGMTAFLVRGVDIPMFSGQTWTFSIGDLIVFLSLFLLFIEIVKATRTTAASIVNHGLSMLIFVIFVVQFITMQGFATSAFFLLTAMALVDVIAGFTISIVAAKRDFGVGPGIAGTA